MEDSFEFNNIEEAQEMEFAKKLFEFSYIKSIYISKNFISITKYDIKKVKISKKQTENTVSQKSFIDSFLSSIKQKMYGQRQRKNK